MAVHRIGLAGCLHKRMKDITTIRGYAKVCIDMQMQLMKLIKELELTDFYSTGDWFDIGYGSDTSAALAHTDIDREMASLLNGHFYGVIGNHIKLRMDSNPELFLIQPHPYFTSRHKIIRKDQIIKTPDVIMHGRVQISFMHWNNVAKNVLDWHPMRRPETLYHIALFHTEDVIPAFKLRQLNMHYEASANSKIADCLDGVDLAIVGHIHKPLGTFQIERVDGRKTTMIIPGSLTNTNAGMLTRHNSIEMPILEIDDEANTVAISYHHLDLMTNRLTFMDKSQQKDGEKLQSLRGNNVQTLHEDFVGAPLVGNGNIQFNTLNGFMKSQQYTEGDKNIVRTVMQNPEGLDDIIKIFKTMEGSLADG